MKVEDRDTEYYQDELAGWCNSEHGNLTATILKARYYAQHPDGFEFEGEKLDFEQWIGVSEGHITEAVHTEWSNMSRAALEAQWAILAAIKRKDWDEKDWDEYRQAQKIRQEREQAASDRIKQEAAQRTAKLAQV